MSQARSIIRAALIVSLLAAAGGCGEEGGVVRPDAAGDGDSAALSADDAADLRDAGGIPLADSHVFFEFNSTDNDLGFQVMLDGEDWERMKIFSSEERKILDIAGAGALGELGLTELRFESAEPSPAEVLALFPPGRYAFAGRTTEGERLFGEGMLSHDLAAAPVFTPSGGQVVDHENVVIAWGDAAGAASWEVIVADEESGRSLEVQLAGEIRELRVPATFLRPGAEYKAEVLAVSENGNKTISEGLFSTLP